MKRFLFRDLSDEFQCSAYVIGTDIIFVLDFLKTHAARKAANHNSDRHT